MKIKPVILCGGSGSRLWPSSRKTLPKQFINFFNDKSLLDLTFSRCKEVFDEQPFIISSNEYKHFIEESANKYFSECTYIYEGSGRNTAPAIYLAASLVELTEEPSILLIMPSDHLIDDYHSFKESFKGLLNLDNLPNWTTFGVKPNEPSTAYGYISSKTNNDLGYRMVDSFIEKPNKEKASELIKDSDIFWNSGIFLGHSSQIISSINKHANSIANACNEIVHNIDTTSKIFSFTKDQMDSIPSESIDYAVLEYEQSIGLVELKSSWSDLGSWDELSKSVESDSHNVIEIQANNNFIKSNKKVVALLGVNDLKIIDTGDALLVSKKGSSGLMKDLVENLNKNHPETLNTHDFEIRPWGKFENLLDEPYCKVKRITVSPGKSLSLQYHFKRSEHWVVVQGEATITIGDEDFIKNQGESVYIPVEEKHCLKNHTDKPIIIIETQVGSYFGEDDIVRIEDPYNR
jgi:mannose-1-phosphate guanylyltransferase